MPCPAPFRTALPALALALAVMTATPAMAQNQSTYTRIDLDECLILNADDFGVQWACPGYKGMPLYVAEGDLRFFVSYGFGAPDEMAAEQTLAPFNYLNSTLEWRLSNATGKWKPFATILRWFTDLPDGDTGNFTKGEVLVVTRIEPGNTCHIARIDAKKTPNANIIARNLADSLAPGFDCTADTPVSVPENIFGPAG